MSLVICCSFSTSPIFSFVPLSHQLASTRKYSLRKPGRGYREGVASCLEKSPSIMVSRHCLTNYYGFDTLGTLTFSRSTRLSLPRVRILGMCHHTGIKSSSLGGNSVAWLYQSNTPLLHPIQTGTLPSPANVSSETICSFHEGDRLLSPCARCIAVTRPVCLVLC